MFYFESEISVFFFYYVGLGKEKLKMWLIIIGYFGIVFEENLGRGIMWL